MKMMRNFKAFCARFGKASQGNVAIIFGFTMIPVMVLIGGLVDYGMAIKTKSQLTATLDAAILAAMLKYSEDPEVDFEGIINNYVKKNFIESDKKIHGTIIEVGTPQVSQDGEMTATITANVPTAFLKFAHFDEFEFTVKAGAMVGGSSIEVALVLDNTGSMKGSKITALKSAANDLIDIILPVDYDNSAEKIKFSIVPFADYANIGEKVSGQYVVVGRADRAEPGTDIPDNYTHNWVQEAYNNCWNEYPDSTEECTNNPYEGTCYNDGVPYSCMKDDWSCTGDPGDPVEQCEWVDEKNKSKKYKWFGCVGSRPHDLNTKDESYETGVPGIMKGYCKNQIASVTRLTSDRSDIVSGISKMKAKRNTYIPSGLAWGWRTITSSAPFADGVPYTNDSVRKVIVLMTDGANTKSMRKWTGNDTINNAGEVWGHNRSNKAEANTYTAELCANIKAQGIMIYTIGFDIEGDSETENLMKACAGSGGQYFDADDSTELADAFQEIGKSLLNLRLTH